MKYILTTTAKRTNAKRHIVKRSHDYYLLESLARWSLDRKNYIVEIYTGNWELVKRFGATKQEYGEDIF